MNPGPKMQVYWEYPELVRDSVAEALPELYFSTLAKGDPLFALTVLATVNNLLISDNGGNVDLHEKLNADLLPKELLEAVARQGSGDAAFRVVFHRLSLLLNMKLILGINTQ